MAELRTTGISTSQSWQEFFESNDAEAARRAWRERQDQFARQQPLAHPESLLSRVWRTPGELHPHFQAGSLEPGTLANIAVWDIEDPSFWPCPDANNFLSRLAMADTTSALHALIVAGRVIGEAGDLRRSLVESKAYQEARGEAERRRQALMDL